MDFKAPPDEPTGSDSPQNIDENKLAAGDEEKTGGKKIGRPTRYSAAMADRICEQIEDNRSLREICKMDGMPGGPQVIFSWLRKYPSFHEQYTRSKKIQADMTYSDIQDIEKEMKDGTIDTQAGRAIIDSMKWRAGKMRPTVYGEHQKITVDVESVEQKLRKIRENQARAIDVTPSRAVDDV